MKVFDCCIFRDEIELLKIRLEELYDHVDWFVVVESNRTFSGENKTFSVEEHIGELAKYIDKIRYMKITNMPKLINGYRRVLETYQRNSIVNGLWDTQNDDIILISDVDEIWDWRCLDRNMEVPVTFEMLPIAGYLDRVCMNTTWFGTLAIHNYLLKSMSPEDHRMRKNGYKIVKGGWHFTSVGSDEQIRRKYMTICHYLLDMETFVDNHLVKRKSLEEHYLLDLSQLPACIGKDVQYYRDKGLLYEL